LLAADPERRIAQQILFEWLTPGAMQMSGGHLVRFVADWGFLLDPLSAVMVLVVTGVGFVIHVYSVGYMAHEGGYYRFFGYMNLFMFAMLTLVLANTCFSCLSAGRRRLVQLFANWILFPEEVGFRCGKESVHRESDWRRRILTRTVADGSDPGHNSLHFARFAGVGGLFGNIAVAGGGGACGHACLWRSCAHGNRIAAFRRRGRKVGADSALRLATGCHGGPTR